MSQGLREDPLKEPKEPYHFIVRMAEKYKIAIPTLGLVHNPKTKNNSGRGLANQRNYQLKFPTLKMISLVLAMPEMVFST